MSWPPGGCGWPGCGRGSAAPRRHPPWRAPAAAAPTPCWPARQSAAPPVQILDIRHTRDGTIGTSMKRAGSVKFEASKLQRKPLLG